MIGLNVMSEFIVGYMIPGNPFANMIGKTYGCNILYQVRSSLYETDDQALDFVKGSKLGLYKDIPPRAVFRIQLLATIESYHPLKIQITVVQSCRYWLSMFYEQTFREFVHLSKPIISPVLGLFKSLMRLSSGAYYPGPEIAKFKVIGPQRIFAPGMLYSGVLWFFLLGALLPIPRFLWLRKYPDHWVKKIDIPLIMGGLYPFLRDINFRYRLDSAS